MNNFVLDFVKYFDNLIKTNKIECYNSTLNFILPIHPNPNVYKHKHILKYVNVINPIPYDKMINLLANCKIIISEPVITMGIFAQEMFDLPFCI